MGYVRPKRAKRPANRPKWPSHSFRRRVWATRFFEIHDPGAFDEHFFNGLLDLIGTEGRALQHAWSASSPVSDQPLSGQIEWEEHQVAEVITSTTIPDTEKQAIVMARRGQGLFRKRVAQIERRCRVTGVTAAEFLRASHAKPWRDSSNEERLDGENGFLLTPDVDLLFDRGFISFKDNGDVLVSPVADRAEIAKMGLADHMLDNVGTFTFKQRNYLVDTEDPPEPA